MTITIPDWITCWLCTWQFWLGVGLSALAVGVAVLNALRNFKPFG